MKKLIISALLIVFGSVYALAQDTEMAMEAAPSVAISGGGKMALKQVSGGELSTVGEYDVKFASSGVTDGGLTFGASIALDGRVDNSIAGDGFAAYIGGADGSWKLQFGDNDEGIATVGGFGVADPDDGAFGTKEMFHDMAAVPADPGEEIPNTGTPAVDATGTLAGGTFTVVGTALTLTIPTAEVLNVDDDNPELVLADTEAQIGTSIRTADTGGTGSTEEAPVPATITIAATNLDRKIDLASQTYYFVLKGLADDDAIHNGKRIYRHKNYLDPTNDDSDDDTATTDTEAEAVDKLFTLNVMDSLGYQMAVDAVPNRRINKKDAVPAMTSLVAEPSSLKAIALSGSVASVSYALTAGTGDAQGWSFGTKYDAGVVTVGLGMNSNSVLSASVGGSVTNIGYEFIYVRQSGMTRSVAAATAAGDAGLVGVNNWNAYGLKVSSDLGGDSDVAVKYSKLTDKNGNDTGAMNATQIEVDFNYGLGGGASFFMEYDRVSETMGTMPDESTNTIQAGIKMSF